jgi:hypothetical protein
MAASHEFGDAARQAIRIGVVPVHRLAHARIAAEREVSEESRLRNLADERLWKAELGEIVAKIVGTVPAFAVPREVRRTFATKVGLMVPTQSTSITMGLTLENWPPVLPGPVMPL